MLILYLPWRVESELIGHEGTFASKFQEPGVTEVVNENRKSFEPYGASVDEALEYIQNNPQYRLYGERFDTFAEQENAETEVAFLESQFGSTSTNGNGNSVINVQVFPSQVQSLQIGTS